MLATIVHLMECTIILITTIGLAIFTLGASLIAKLMEISQLLIPLLKVN